MKRFTYKDMEDLVENFERELEPFFSYVAREGRASTLFEDQVWTEVTPEEFLEEAEVIILEKPETVDEIEAFFEDVVIEPSIREEGEYLDYVEPRILVEIEKMYDDGDSFRVVVKFEEDI